MDERDYLIRHFAQMVEFATELKALPAEVLHHTYSYESFGSWSAIVRYRGNPFRIVFDGKEGELIVQRANGSKAPYSWQNPFWQRATLSGNNIPTHEIVAAIR